MPGRLSPDEDAKPLLVPFRSRGIKPFGEMGLEEARAVLMHYLRWQGWPWDDVAEIMNCTVESAWLTASSFPDAFEGTDPPPEPDCTP